MLPVKNKKVLLSLVIVLCLISGLLIIFYPTNSRNQPNLNKSKNSFQKLDDTSTDLKDSKISIPIHIDNNWSDAQLAGICSGAGTYSNPYIIKDLVIDGSQSKRGILIENSQDYFRIENNTLYNAGNGWEPKYIAGIILNNTWNGIIKNNTCYLNDVDGITIKNSENITIIDNNLHDNKRNGLYIENSNNISIIYNNFESNDWLGIIFDNSTNINVVNNTMFNNEDAAISVGDDSTNFTISDNIFINDNLEISEAYYIDILNNTFTNCYIDFYGRYDYLATLTIDIKNRINGRPIYQYKDKVGLGFNNFTYTGIPGQVILVNCNNSIINKLNFSKGLAGISLFNSNNNKIVECNLTDNEEGILLSSVFNITVMKNILVNNRGIISWDSCHNSTFYNNSILYANLGIQFHGYSNYNNISNNHINYNEQSGISFETSSNYNWIINNTLTENDDHGIRIEGKENILQKNKMTNCGIQINSQLREYAGSNVIDFSNKINGKSVYYYGNKENLKPINFTIVGAPGQILLGNCNNSEITDFSISQSSVGISLLFCDNNTITRNTLSENMVNGLSLYHSVNNTVYDNDLINNDEYGINLYEDSNFNNITNNRLNGNGWSGIMLRDNCNNNTILNNIIRDNEAQGIYLSSRCENNTITYNTIIYNVDGIRLTQSHYNVITFNNIKNNEDEGISLYGCYNTLIKGNIIHYNGHGYWYYPTIGNIYFNGYGVYLDESNNNTVTENEFLGNKNNIEEEDCKDNKIYNNYFLFIPATGGGDDDDEEGAEDNQIYVIILFIIVSSMIVVVVTPLYYYHHRNKKTESIRKFGFQESNGMTRSTPNSKKDLIKLTNKKLILQIFETKKVKKINAQLDRIDLTVVSNNFLNKLDALNIDKIEKIEFLKEMLLFSPEERNEILDNILKRLNSYSEGE